MKNQKKTMSVEQKESEGFDFNSLVMLCLQTHEEMKHQAARSVNTALVVRNWLIGWYVVEYEQCGADRAVYGASTLKRLSAALKKTVSRGFSVDSLEQIRRFYLAYRNEASPVEKSETPSQIFSPKISETLSRISLPSVEPLKIQHFTLSWSHYVSLLSIDLPEERRFYEIEAAENSWSVRELERQISSSLFERLALSRDKQEILKLSKQGQVVEKAADLIKNPLVLEFLELEEKPAYSEEKLESAIIDKLEQFLLELGKGFLFEARQKRFTFDNDHFYVDLVFYNRLLQCYVLIDLKRDKLTHKDLGQMQMYVNHFDRYVKTDEEKPTIGMVLCHRKNDALVELTLPEDANIFASKYQLYLPSKEELEKELKTITEELKQNATDGK